MEQQDRCEVRAILGAGQGAVMDLSIGSVVVCFLYACHWEDLEFVLKFPRWYFGTLSKEVYIGRKYGLTG